MEAQAFWTDKKDLFQDSIYSYNRAIAMGDPKLTAETRVDFPLHARGSWLSKALSSQASDLVHSRDFTGFIASLAIWSTNQAERSFLEATLQLRHPTNPTGVHALNFLRSCEDAPAGSHFLQDFLAPVHHMLAFVVFYFIIRAAQRLQKDGSKKTAPQRRPVRYWTLTRGTSRSTRFSCCLMWQQCNGFARWGSVSFTLYRLCIQASTRGPLSGLRGVQDRAGAGLGRERPGPSC